jgi:hypothetical protein
LPVDQLGEVAANREGVAVYASMLFEVSRIYNN